LHDHLDLGAVLIVVLQRRQRHLRCAGVGIAQDQQPASGDTHGQDRTAQHGCSMHALQRRKQGLQDGFAGCGHQ